MLEGVSAVEATLERAVRTFSWVMAAPDGIWRFDGGLENASLPVTTLIHCISLENAQIACHPSELDPNSRTLSLLRHPQTR